MFFEKTQVKCLLREARDLKKAQMGRQTAISRPRKLHSDGSSLAYFPPDAHFGNTVLELSRSFTDHKRDVLRIADQFKLWC